MFLLKDWQSEGKKKIYRMESNEEHFLHLRLEIKPAVIIRIVLMRNVSQLFSCERSALNYCLFHARG